MADQTAELECTRYAEPDSCGESDDCITEWCWPCLLMHIEELQDANKRLRSLAQLARHRRNCAYTDDLCNCSYDEFYVACIKAGDLQDG